MNGKWFNLINRPMIFEDIEYIRGSKIAQEIFMLVDRYAKEKLMICNGRLMANNLNDGENHITTAPIYRLWEYVSLIELVGLCNHTNSLVKNKSLNILDCGGCSSAIDFFLAEKGFQVCSIDLDEFLIFNGNYIAKAKQLPLKNMKADMTQLPFENNSFDIVFSISVLEHIDKKLRGLAIQEMERVVKPGGFIFNTFDYGEYPDIKEVNYNIPSEYSRLIVIKDVDEVIELTKSASNSRIVGNLDTGDLNFLPKKAPAHGEYRIYLDLKKNFNAFTSFRDVRHWLIKFMRFKMFPKNLVRIYQKGRFYNFFRLVLQKRE